MAEWQRLSYECVARLFAESLYLRRFMGVGSSRIARQAGTGLPWHSKTEGLGSIERGGSQAISCRRTPS